MSPSNQPVDSFIPLAVPSIDESDKTSVNRAIDSGFVSSAGAQIHEFERAFADYVGAKFAVACASGTAALHLAMRIAGVQAGDLVAVSDFTFMASANAPSYQGASLLLVDSEESSWGMDVSSLRMELVRRRDAGLKLPKVLELVHILGQPADAESAYELAEEFGMVLVEDAAESLGATWSSGRLRGKHVGTVGRFGAFSFNGNKIMTTGGGGMLTMDNEDDAVLAKHLSTQARVPDIGYLHDAVGFNYRLTNLAAALGLSQLRKLDGFVEAKRRIAANYDSAFIGSGITCPPRLDSTESTYWLYSILVPGGVEQRDSLLRQLQTNGIGARALWRPLQDQPPLVGSEAVGGAIGRELFARGLSLPCSTDLTEGDQNRVIGAVLSWLTEQGL